MEGARVGTGVAHLSCELELHNATRTLVALSHRCDDFFSLYLARVLQLSWVASSVSDHLHAGYNSIKEPRGYAGFGCGTVRTYHAYDCVVLCVGSDVWCCEHSHARANTKYHTVKATILIAHHEFASTLLAGLGTVALSISPCALRTGPRHGGPPSARRPSLGTAALPRCGGLARQVALRTAASVRRPSIRRPALRAQRTCVAMHAVAEWARVPLGGAGGRGGMSQVRIGGAPVEAAAASGGEQGGGSRAWSPHTPRAGLRASEGRVSGQCERVVGMRRGSNL